MTIDEIKALFPLKGKVTEKMCNADKGDWQNCTGAMALKSILPEEIRNQVTWIDAIGNIWVDNAPISITTKESISMMQLNKPTSVTFILFDQN